MTALIILVLAIAFALGTALTFLRSPTSNPLAELSKHGKRTQAKITAIEGSGDALSVQIEYSVENQPFQRTVPWLGAELPRLNEEIEIVYLPDSPGLSRIALD